MVTVIEPSDSLLTNGKASGKVNNGGIYLIVVVRIIEKGICAHRETAGAIGVGTVKTDTMGAKRANAVRGIEIVGIHTRHDVDGSSQRISTQRHGQHSLIHLNAIGKTGRDAGQTETGTEMVHGHSVKEKLHLIARETVH